MRAVGGGVSVVRGVGSAVGSAVTVAADGLESVGDPMSFGELHAARTNRRITSSGRMRILPSLERKVIATLSPDLARRVEAKEAGCAFEVPSGTITGTIDRSRELGGVWPVRAWSGLGLRVGICRLRMGLLCEPIHRTRMHVLSEEGSLEVSLVQVDHMPTLSALVERASRYRRGHR